MIMDMGDGHKEIHPKHKNYNDVLIKDIKFL